MIGSLIGAGVQAIGSIVGGISASKAMNQARKMVEDQKQRNQAWYDRRYNEDATQRADAQRMISMTNEAIRDRNKQAAGMAAVTGATEEAAAATKAANAEAMAGAMSAITANAEARKDTIEQQYMQNDQSLTNQLVDVQKGKAQGISAATQGVIEAGNTIAGLDKIGGK